MKRRLFSPRNPLETALRDEVLSMRRARQIDILALSPHLRRDIGLGDGIPPLGTSRRPK